MPAVVLLQDLVDEMEIHSDELSSFVNLDTGEVEVIHKDLLRDAEDDPDEEPDLPAWQHREWETAKKIVLTDRFLALPSKFEVNDWEIMRDFSDAQESGDLREDLLDAIHGAGAFRNFKYRIRLDNIEQEWYRFRDNAFKQIAIEWCKKHQLEYRDVPRSRSAAS